MKYDIFISYSRKDAQQVNSLIDRLRDEIRGIKIWYDIDGMESAADFQSKIISAINNSKVVLFLCSENSLKSEYCRKEIMYAKNTGKTVIPFLLPGTTLEGWLLFEFGNINCINSQKEEEVRRMIRDLKQWSGKDFFLSGNTPRQPKSNPLESSLEFDSASGEFKQKTNATVSVNDRTDSGYINGHEYIDLGLPSGLKWATSNVGASSPEEYGDYFAWGQTKPLQSNLAIFERYKTNVNWLQRKFVDEYSWLQKQGIIGENGNLTMSYDAARHIWGGTWRMPTKDEIEELIQHTDKEYIKFNDKFGYVIKSKINGKSIFLPAAGFCRRSEPVHTITQGFYLSSTASKDYAQSAYVISFVAHRINTLWTLISEMYSIRPVSN